MTLQGSGNSVIGELPRRQECEKCNGDGRVAARFSILMLEFDRMMLVMEPGDERLKAMYKLYRDWSDNGQTLICDECDGRGRV